MEREKAMLRNAFSFNERVMKNHLSTSRKFRRTPKPAEASDALRQKGNALYTQKPHDHHIHQEIFQNYCRAILTAPNDLEDLALGYGNRSAFLLHIKRYNDCIKDIDRAVKITKSGTLKVKLLCRKAECLKKLGSAEQEAVLEEADKHVSKMNRKDNKMYNALIEKVKAMTINADSSPEEERTIRSETKDVAECIEIGYNKKFGRHLLAAKDYAPGDIIFVEKTYAAHINRRMIFTNCDYCLKTAWSGVPCRNCSWTIFCSEECRDKAAELYHDVECSLIPFLKLTLKDDLLDMMRLVLRAVIIAVKEAGSVSELMDRLKAVDACTDMSSKGFYKNGKLESYTIESMYSLCSDHPEPDYAFVGQASAVLMVLIGLSTQTEFFKKFSLKKIDDLVKSNELMFLGSLMIKLINIRRNTNDALFGKYKTCELGNSLDQCLATSCCVRGYFMAPLTSLINHSCFPNAGRCFADNKQIYIHAIHPIKKGEQISMAYYCYFYNVPLSERQTSLKVRNIFKCFCQACKEDWPPLLKMSEEVLDKYKLGMHTELEKKLYDDCSTILIAFEKKNVIKNKFSYFKTGDLEKLSEALSKAFHHLKQPSYLTSLLAYSLSEVFSYIYGLKPRHFGTCEYYQYSDQDYV